MGDVSVIFSNIAALNLPDADKDTRDGASDPFVVFDIVVGGRTFSGRTPTRENARNVQWDEEVTVVLEGPLRISELHCVPLRISVWDDDDEEKGEADEPMGRREEKLDCNGRERSETRVLTGVGSLYSFHVSFSYRLVDSLLAAGTRARVCTWVPPVGPEAENIRVTNEGQTITRLHYRGAAAGTSVATSSPVLSGQQESTITFKIHHSDGGRGMFVGVGASTTNAAWPGRVIFLSIHSGRCFTGKSADFPSHMLNGTLSVKSCSELARRLDEGYVLVRMRVDMSARKVYFAVDSLPWVDSGAETIPSSLRPCVILSDHEGASISLVDKVVFTEASRRDLHGLTPAPAPGASYWNKIKGSTNQL